MKCPCAATLVAAFVDDMYDLIVQTADAPGVDRRLHVDHLKLRAWRWFVQGSLDGEPDQELGLVDIIEANACD